MNDVRTCRSRFTTPAFLWAIAALLTELVIEWLPRFGVRLPAPRLLRHLPLIAALFVVVALVRTVQKMDELQKRIYLESTFIAFVLTLVLMAIFAAVEQAGIYRAPGDLGGYMIFLWACAYAFCARRYR